MQEEYPFMSVIKHKFIILFLFIFTSFASAEISQTDQLNKLFNKLIKSHNVDTANLVEQEIWLYGINIQKI